MDCFTVVHKGWAVLRKKELNPVTGNPINELRLSVSPCLSSLPSCAPRISRSCLGLRPRDHTHELIAVHRLLVASPPTSSLVVARRGVRPKALAASASSYQAIYHFLQSTTHICTFMSLSRTLSRVFMYTSTCAHDLHGHTAHAHASLQPASSRHS